MADATAPQDQWDCEAYGPEGRETGALCFISGEPGKRVCDSPADCRETMTVQRQRVFRRIRELAADGDPTAVFLAESFTSPEQLLGGGGSDPADAGNPG